MQPSRVGPYLIEKKLGAGGMGTVYYGRHAETGAEAAVKVLPASLAREEGFVARFTREIGALKQLKNPHIVQFFENGVDGETYFYAMEYVDGETLIELLHRQKRIPWTDVIEIAMQICTALKAAHDAGIIHRDLKPSNLLVNSQGMVKLTDFGIAQVFAGTKLTATGGIVGTAEYMSPEQAQGKPATKQSDLYSLGAVMYALLTGRPPFTGKTTLDVIQKHKYGLFDRPSLIATDMPHWLEDIVCQLLEKEPEKRFPDAFVLSRRLQEVVNKVALSAQDATQAAPGEYDGTAPTVAAVGEASGAPAGPGEATLMRDLVRAELEGVQAGGPLSGFFNNTWVLLALLAFIVVGGVFWFRNMELSPEKKLEAAQALLKQSEGAAWLEARDKYLQPLLDSNPDRWRKDVEPLLEKIALYEFKTGSEPKLQLQKLSVPENEPERFLQLTRHYLRMGDAARAQRTLSALISLLAEQPEYAELERKSRNWLKELQAKQADKTQRYALVRKSMERAVQLAADGKWNETRELCSSIIELYGSDLGAQEFVVRARELLKKQTTAEP